MKAAAVARAFATPLPAVLDLPLDELDTWARLALDLAETARGGA